MGCEPEYPERRGDLPRSEYVGILHFSSSPSAALPHRIVRTFPPAASLHSFRLPPLQALFRQPSSAFATAISSPYILTRREMLSSRKSLTLARDDAARRIGLLAFQGPRWSADSSDASVQSSSPSDLHGEISRIYGVICEVLEVPPPPAPSSKRSRSSISALPSAGSHLAASPSALLTVLTAHLPRARQVIDKGLAAQRRPSVLTRLWFPFLFLPPGLWIASSTLLRNKDWMRAQLRNGRETIQGFVVQWVWEPLEGIGKTLRGGGEGLGVAPSTVKSDQDVSGLFFPQIIADEAVIGKNGARFRKRLLSSLRSGVGCTRREGAEWRYGRSLESLRKGDAGVCLRSSMLH